MGINVNEKTRTAIIFRGDEPYAPPAKPGFTPVQNAVFPSSQFRQRPSATLNGMTTRSPFFSRVTPSPSSSTRPRFSCPYLVHSCQCQQIYILELDVPKVIPGSAAVLPSYMLGTCEQHCWMNSLLPYPQFHSLQIRTTDGCLSWLSVNSTEIHSGFATYTGNLDDNVIGVLQLGPLHLLHLDREWSHVVQCFHRLGCHLCSDRSNKSDKINGNRSDVGWMPFMLCTYWGISIEKWGEGKDVRSGGTRWGRGER